MEKSSISAWAPANISLIFKVFENKDPQKKGSYGLGFTIDQGVTVTVSKSDETEILFNGKPIDFPTVTYVVEKTLHLVQDDKEKNQEEMFVNVKISSYLPIGCGFGLSGASALATSYALNELFELHKTKLELAKIAHTAEVINSTGLGDVVNQYFGGFLLKIKPSSDFMVEKIPLTNIPIYCKVFSTLKTSSVLSNNQMMTTLEKEATHAMQEVQHILQEGNLHLGKICMIARSFAESSHLITSKEVEDALQEITALGGHGTMILLGNAVVSDTPFSGSIRYNIASVGAHLI